MRKLAYFGLLAASLGADDTAYELYTSEVVPTAVFVSQKTELGVSRYVVFYREFGRDHCAVRRDKHLDDEVNSLKQAADLRLPVFLGRWYASNKPCLYLEVVGNRHSALRKYKNSRK
jgi:hypothetical protein